MTKKWINLNLPGALHYVTGNVRHRLPIFNQEKCCLAFIDVCAALQRSWPSKLIVFVIMPDQFHLIDNPRDGNIQGFAGALKSLLAARIIEVTNDKRFDLPICTYVRPRRSRCREEKTRAIRNAVLNALGAMSAFGPKQP